MVTAWINGRFEKGKYEEKEAEVGSGEKVSRYVWGDGT